MFGHRDWNAFSQHSSIGLNGAFSRLIWHTIYGVHQKCRFQVFSFSFILICILILVFALNSQYSFCSHNSLSQSFNHCCSYYLTFTVQIHCFLNSMISFIERERATKKKHRMRSDIHTIENVNTCSFLLCWRNVSNCPAASIWMVSFVNGLQQCLLLLFLLLLFFCIRLRCIHSTK